MTSTELSGSLVPLKAPPARPVLRWIAVIPAAICSAVIASIVVRTVNRITDWGMGFNPDAPFVRIYQEAVENWLLGAAAVWIAAYVAPTKQRETALLGCAVVLIISGFMVAATAANRDWWAIYGSLWVAVGAGSVGWQAHKNELGL